jgi:hypothetical protein
MKQEERKQILKKRGIKEQKNLIIILHNPAEKLQEAFLQGDLHQKEDDYNL